MKEIKVEEDVEEMDEKFEYEEQENDKSIFKCESVNFECDRIDNKVDCHNNDSIDAILEKKRAEEELSSVTIANLRNLRIRLRHEVPPQHQIERMAGSHVLSKAEKEAFKQLVPGNVIKNGTYTSKEDQLIARNWKAFCKMHNWDKHNPKPFLYMRQYNGIFYIKRESDRKKFVQFLADGLPSRTLYSVYHRFRTLYDTPRLRAKYTCREDEYIINHIERNKSLDKTRMFSDLAVALNRSRASVWRRYKLLKRKRTNADFDDD